jgi:hypothetical protein
MTSGRSVRFARWLAVAVALLLAAGPALAAPADDEATVLERRVKAAFVYKFAGYVEWPAATFSQPDAPITMAVVGDDELAAELAQVVAGRTVDGRPLFVKKPRFGESIADVHILLVGRAELARLPQWGRLTQSKPVLIVADGGALTQGGVINFVLVQQRVKFEISLEEADKRGLKLSSRLLAVAHFVRKAPPP